jgi:hypothetical protein
MLGVGSQQDQSLFAVYNVRVQHANDRGDVTRAWNVIRRYSDFFKLNVTIQQKVRFLNTLFYLFFLVSKASKHRVSGKENV